eukprot:m.35072 g.35072  ORF g.35072 m.35072 type:complete len:321 (-) comp12742_c0_seq1:58-1020(-)
MWLSNLSAALDLDDSGSQSDDQQEAPLIDPKTPDVTLVGEISKFGGSLLYEGGALLQEMNHHVFSGAVVDMLAPEDEDEDRSTHRLQSAETYQRTSKHDHTTAQNLLDPKKLTAPKTVGVVGDDTAQVADLVRCLAQSGHNIAVTCPTKVATAAVGTFNGCSNRDGRSIGVMPEAHAASYRRDRQFLSEPEVPVFVQPRDVLRTLVCSCDVLVILGDDSKVVRELMRLRGAGATAVRLAASPKRSTASPFLGSTVKTVEEALEHVHQILSSNISADTARFTDAAVVDDLVCVESVDKEEGDDDGLGTYEVVDFIEGGGRR